MANWKPVEVLGVPLDVDTTEQKDCFQLAIHHFNRPNTSGEVERLSMARNEAYRRVVDFLMKERKYAEINIGRWVLVKPRDESGFTLEEFDLLVKAALEII